MRSGEPRGGRGSGCGSLLELFIAAPSSRAPLPSARRSPGPPPPRPGIPGPHPLPAPDPAPGPRRGRGRCDSPSPAPYLPCPRAARQGEGRTGFSLGGAPGEGETQRGTPRSRPQEQARFLPAQPWRRCPLDCLRPSSSGPVHDEPSSLPSPAVDPHTCAACPPPHAPCAPAAPPRPAPHLWDPVPTSHWSLPPTASSPSSPRLSLHLCPSGQLCPPQPGAHPSPARRGPPWLHLHPLSCPAPCSSSSPHSPPPAAPPFWPLPCNTSQSEAIKLCTLINPKEWAVGTPEPPTLHRNHPTLVQPTSDPIPVMVSTSEARQDLAEAAGPVKFGL